MILPGLPFGLSGVKKPIEFVAGTGRTFNAGSTLALPSGLLPNDLVLVFMATVGTPSGYTPVTSLDDSRRVFYKFMSSPVDTQIVSTAGSDFIGTALVFRNVNRTTPLDVSPPSWTNASGVAPDPPAITTVTKGCAIVAFGFYFGALGGSSPVAPSTYTLTGAGDGSSFRNHTWAAAYRLVSAPGIYNPGLFSPVSGGGSGATIALRPQ